MPLTKYFIIIFITAILSVTAQAEIFERNLPTISYIQYQSFNPMNPEVPLTISGQLRIPPPYNEEQHSPHTVPAVLVLHGSAGVDSRGELYIDALNDAGIATLEIDMWAARGLAGGINRPALPTLTVPDAFSALKYLSEIPHIDAERIGIMGFSWGGVVTMLAATEAYATLYGNGLTFAAHVAHYPVCWAYNIGITGMEFHTLTGSPLLIQVGDLDDYDEGGAPCENLIASLSEPEQSIASVNVYPNAYHGWDRLQPALTVSDPFSHLGAGGDVEIIPNPGAASLSRSKAVHFLQKSLGLND